MPTKQTHWFALCVCALLCGLTPNGARAQSQEDDARFQQSEVQNLADVEKKLPLAGLTICIDPGHTSETSAGTQSRDGKLTERRVNWIEAQHLRGMLNANGANVVLTKQTEGQIVTNRHRAEIANSAHAVLLLRLHCDSNAPSGITTYYPDRQGTRFGVTGPSREVIEKSHAAALVFQHALAQSLHGELPNGGVKGDSATFVGGKQGALTGSIFARVPALTVEMCVLTNAHDYAFIRTPKKQEDMARALDAGVLAYARSLPHSTSAQ